jgi:hypothetical protein
MSKLTGLILLVYVNAIVEFALNLIVFGFGLAWALVPFDGC